MWYDLVWRVDGSECICQRKWSWVLSLNRHVDVGMLTTDAGAGDFVELFDIQMNRSEKIMADNDNVMAWLNLDI